jgi:hypothetical protein
MLVFEPTDLLDFMNDAQVDIARKTDILRTSTAINVVNGTEAYPMPVDFIEVQRVTLSGNKLYKTTWQEIDLKDPYKDSGPTLGVPTTYHREGNQIYLYPIPNSSITGGLKIYYSKTPIVLVNDNDIPEIPLSMHEDICIRVIARGHEQVEDYQASTAKATEYNNAISFSQEQAQEGTDEYYPLIRDTENY